MTPDEQAISEGKTCIFTGDYYGSIEEAVEKANNHGGGTVTLIADTVVSRNGKVPDMCFNSNFAIRSKKGGPTYRIYRGGLDRREMLQITDGVLRLFDVTLDGGCDGPAFCAAIRISDRGRVEMSGVTICGNYTTNAGNAANQGATAVCCIGANASFKMSSGCVIRDNAGTGSAISAIVASGGTITNEGAVFEGNTSDNGKNPDYTDLTGTTRFEGLPILQA